MIVPQQKGSPLIGLRYGVPGPAFLNSQAMRILDGTFEDSDGHRANIADRRQQAYDTGERALYRAIMEDAAHILRAYYRGHPEQGPVFYETLEWLEGRCSSAPYCSFEYVCEVLGYEPEFLRRRLRAIAKGPRKNGRFVHGPEMRAGVRTRVASFHINKRTHRPPRKQRG